MKYTVRYQRDESGHWIASVPKVRGCHTYGRSLEEARRRVREALSLFVEGADTAQLVDDVRLPPKARALMSKVLAERRRAQSLQQKAARTAKTAARVLTRQLHLSVRDTGSLLDLSHQRVHQLLEK